MAGKSPTELLEMIAELRGDVAVLAAKQAANEKAIEKLDYADLARRLAVLDDRVAELKKGRDDGDRWFKQLLLIVIGAALALLANVLVNVVLFAKK